MRQALMSVDSSDRERTSAMSSATMWSLVSALTFVSGRLSNMFTIYNSMAPSWFVSGIELAPFGLFGGKPRKKGTLKIKTVGDNGDESPL
ncbi:hypothetical protein Tco_1084852 [Tanacetum coccineum]